LWTYGEKSSDQAWRSATGYRERAWETRAGTAELRIPKLSKAGAWLIAKALDAS
jgi:hypothetical protein